MVNTSIALVWSILLAFAIGFFSYQNKTVLLSPIAKNYIIIPLFSRIKRLIFLSCLLLLFIEWVFLIQTTTPLPPSAKTIFLTDVSQSMLTEDISPGKSRLYAMKDLLLSALTQEGQPIELLAFKWKANILIPATLDTSLLRNAINSLSPESAPGKWSDIVSAITFAFSLFSNEEQGSLVIFTDGDDHPVDTPSLELLRKSHPNIIVKIVLFGSKKWGPIPIGKTPLGEIAYLKSTDGNVVTTPRNTKNISFLEKALDAKIIESSKYSKADLYPSRLGWETPIFFFASRNDLIIWITSILMLLSIILPYRKPLWKK